MDDLLTALDKVLTERKTASPESSYVAALNAKGLNKILEKVGEEATEVILAAKDAAESGDSEALVNAVAEPGFPTMAMRAHLYIDHTDVLPVLDGRMGLSGLAEKAAGKGHNAASEDA